MKPISNINTINYKTTSNAVLPTRRPDPIHHFRLIQRLGFHPGFRCWCGAELEFAVKEDWASRDRKRKVFFDQHEECEARHE